MSIYLGTNSPTGTEMRKEVLVGVCIKDCITYKIRNDIISLDDSLEHLWVKVKGKNKKLPYLIGIVYHPSFENAKKIDRIEKVDAVLSSIKST